MNASALGFLGKLLLVSAAISAVIKFAGPLLALPEEGISNAGALAIVLLPPVVMGTFLLLRWRR